MAIQQQHNILLETGTNEVEFVRFSVAGGDYGINVAKVKSIILYDSELVTPLPQAHPSVEGMFLLQGESHTLIDLHRYLTDEPMPHEGSRTLIMVAEMNQEICGFVIEGVKRIYRTSWESFDPMDSAVLDGGVPIVGSVRIDKELVLILDFESILADISPKSRIQNSHDHATYVKESSPLDRGRVPIVMAEDSRIIRMEMVGLLQEAGYTSVGVFENGKLALDYIRRCSEEGDSKYLREKVGIVITDIEMPMMDGTTLCRRLKEYPQTAAIPVVLYSSMANEDLAQRFKSVGADGYVSKREIPRLLSILDDLAKKMLDS